MDDVTLMMGDCLERMGEIANGSVDLIAADLPYGTTQARWDSVIPFEPLWEHYRRVLKSVGAIILTSCQPFTSALVMSNPKWFRYEWVWNKVQPTGHLDAKRRPLRVHESVIVFSPSATVYNPQMGTGIAIKRTPGGKQTEIYGPFVSTGRPSGTERYPTSLITISAGRSPHSRTVHPTQKPVALLEYLIRTYSNPGDLVLDSCMGSGTTLIAAINTERRAIGIERDPAIFETARTRIAAHQSSTPLLAGVS